MLIQVKEEKGKIICILLFLLLNKIIFAQQPNLVLPVGHTSAITAATYSADEKYIVTSSWDNTAKVWQASDGRLLKELKGHTASLTSAAFSPDGKFIVTASKDKTARIWRTDNGSFIGELKGHNDWVRSASFSNDGKFIVTASWDNSVKIWSTSTRKIFQSLSGHTAPVLSASFSNDSKCVLTTSMDGTAKTWQTATGKILSNLIAHTDWVNDAKFSKDGKFILTASNDGTAKIWAANGRLLKNFSGHSAAVIAASFSKDEKFIVTASNDNTAKLWNVETGNLIKDFKAHSEPLLSASFSNDGNNILTASKDMTVKVWDVSEGNIIYDLKGHSDWVTSASFSYDGKNILTASHDHTGKIWKEGKLINELKGHTSVVTEATYSKDGKYIVAASWDHTAKVWDAFDGRLISNLKGHNNWIHSAAFSNDGKYIVTASSDNTAKVWNVNGKLLHTLDGHTDWINSAVFSPNDQFILTASWDNTAKIWNAANGQLIKELKGHKNTLRSGLFSNDGKLVVTTSNDGEGKIWNAADGNLAQNLIGHTDTIRTAVFSNDGKNILTASWDKTAKIWNVADGKILFDLKGHSHPLLSASYSNDGKYIVTASLDNTARIWSAVNGKMLFELKGHTKPVNTASFSPDGKFVLTASWDNTARVWKVGDGKMMNELKGHTGSLKSASFSPDGKNIITTSEDNTLKNWNALNGELLYTFFAVDSTDYLAIDKDGHYDGTESARKMLYYVCGNEIVDLEQFKDLTWEPGLVGKLMGVNTEPVTAKKLSDINICNYTPVVEEKGYNTGFYLYQITPKNGGLGEVQLYVNGKLIEKIFPSSLQKKNNNYLLKISNDKVQDYFVSGEANQVIVKATTKGGSMISRGASLPAVISKRKTANPNMYILSIGVSQYKGDKLKLQYASKDAIDFASVVAASAKKLLNTDGTEHVFSYTFNTSAGSNMWPTKTAIQNLIDTIAKKATSDDIVVMFFAGHGVLQEGKKNLFLLTADASAFELNGVEKDVAISTNELKEWHQKIKANKQILILDACNTGQVISNLQELIKKREVPADRQRALESLKDKTGLYILSASAEGQVAYETNLFSQGLLTYTLLSGIKLGGGLRDNKFIDVTKWFNYASDNVKILAQDIGGRQEPQIVGNASFEVGIVDKEIIDNIQLSMKKKIFRSSNFIQDEEVMDDEYEISFLVDKELHEISGRGKESSLVFVSDNPLVDAYSIRGKYKVTGNKISINAAVYLGHKQKILPLQLSGTIDKKEELVAQLVEKVQNYFSK